MVLNAVDELVQYKIWLVNMPVQIDLQLFLFLIPAVLIYGMGKGGLGPGVGAVVVPFLSLIIPPTRAAAIILPILCVMDIFAVYKYRKNVNIKQLRFLIPAGVLGIVIASLFIQQFSQRYIRILVGIISVLFCLDFIRKKMIKRDTLSRPHVLSGIFWGVVAGFTSTQIHAGGPPISFYLLPQKLEKKELLGTMAVFFWIINLVKLIPYYYFGQLEFSNLMISVLFFPLAPLGVFLGYRIITKINQSILYGLLYLFLFITGVKLIIEGIF